jgi:exopolyphosphatase/guanosine-5'-triphosphate,3'-diphosphate pyrophosphatase
MTIASIDIGSNSVLLLIAKLDLSLKIITENRTYYRTPRISEGLAGSRYFNNDKIDLLFKILEEFRVIIEQAACEKIILTATKAFRIAKNAQEVIDRIEKELGWKIEIISGDYEARLTFLGTTYPFVNPNENKAVIDIGGGSTEVVMGNSDSIIFKNSFDFGVVSLTERFFKERVPREDEITSASLHLRGEMDYLATRITGYSQVYAVAGTPTTLACIKAGIREFNESFIHDSVLTLQDILTIKNNIARLQPDQILKKYSEIVRGREDVLFAGILILETMMEIAGIPRIVVSTRGLRFGALYHSVGWDQKR